MDIESIINAAPALADVVLENAQASLLTCLGSLRALISLKFTSRKERTRLPIAAHCSDPLECIHRIMHLTTLQDLYVSCRTLEQVPDSIMQLTALQTLHLKFVRDLVDLPDSIGQLTAPQTLSLTCCRG